MIKLIGLILLFPFITWAHPGIGIVKDSKGNIYYTDLERVWKISNGNKTVVVPDAHTHELYMDQADNLYGEGGYYDNNTGKFYHYMWVYRPSGKIDTVVGMKEDYVQIDFSFARDNKGNEYYTKQFLKKPDTNHIYRRSPEGKETVLASGNFKGVIWLHPQEDGSLAFIQKNTLYRVDQSGNINVIKEQLGNITPSFKFSGNNITIWGAWQDNAGNNYIAAFSDQAVKKIDTSGNVSVVYRSEGNWAPLNGVFDNENKLWVLESSDKNEVRVMQASTDIKASGKTGSFLLPLMIIAGSIILAIALLYLVFNNRSATKMSRL